MQQYKPTTIKGVNFKQILSHLTPRIRSESQIVGNNQIWDLLCSRCCHAWNGRQTLLRKDCCIICELELVEGEAVCYPVTSEKHPYFFHKNCLRYSDLTQISEFIDPLDALLKMMTHPWMVPPTNEMVIPKLVTPMRMIDWDSLDDMIARVAAEEARLEKIRIREQREVELEQQRLQSSPV